MMHFFFQFLYIELLYIRKIYYKMDLSIIKHRIDEASHSSNKINEVHCKKIEQYQKTYKKIGQGQQGFIIDWFGALVLKIVPWHSDKDKKYVQEQILERINILIKKKNSLFLPIIPKIINCSQHYIIIMEQFNNTFINFMKINFNNDKYNNAKFAKNLCLQYLTILNLFYEKKFMHGDTKIKNLMFYKIPPKFKRNFKIKKKINDFNYEIEIIDYILTIVDFDSIILYPEEKDIIMKKYKYRVKIIHELLKLFKIFKINDQYFHIIDEHTLDFHKITKKLQYQPKKYNDFFINLYKNNHEFKNIINNYKNTKNKFQNKNIYLFKYPNEIGKYIFNVYFNYFDILNSEKLENIAEILI